MGLFCAVAVDPVRHDSLDQGHLPPALRLTRGHTRRANGRRARVHGPAYSPTLVVTLPTH